MLNKHAIKRWKDIQHKNEDNDNDDDGDMHGCFRDSLCTYFIGTERVHIPFGQSIYDDDGGGAGGEEARWYCLLAGVTLPYMTVF